ncbi:MAG TPA: adenylate/guanylate cyclase domain-containing protein [Bradyrhizobium sp.]|jgi:class 3 adenylate cyclase|nr:adenylate/guanylate cyclase domain-containing protein [Bradyrhizobium sp.]
MMATILFVDDEPDLEALVLQKFRKQIREGAVRVIFAHDGVEALESLERHQVDMVVSDINMPRMDGLSLLQRLQEGEDKKSTIIVSAYGDMNNIRTAMNRGAFDFLTKPIDFGDLETTIDKTIRHIEVLREARRRQAEAERAHASLSRYFSPQLASRLASCNGEDDGMEVQWRDVATIFTDITGFTSLVESAAPEVLGKLLNEYVGGMTDVIFSHEGTVAKIIGDAIQVLFNAPGDQPDFASRAVGCAHALDAWAEDFRKRWKAKGVNFGVTRIGVHAGPALVGNFGGSRFFDYTAYGDTINIAARLESANKFLGTRICVSATVAERAENFQGRPVGDLILRGRSEPLRAYEPLVSEAFKTPAITQYSEAFAKLEAGDATAMPAFAALVGLHADDPLAGFHLKRLLNGAKGVCMQLE